MDVRPRFRLDLVASEFTEADNTKSIVLKDPVSEKFFRLSVFEYQFLKTFNGTLTLEEALEEFKASGHYCSPEDGGMILGKAAQLGLMLGTKFGTAQFQQYLKDLNEKAKKARRFSSVYFLFIPLWNPDRFLERTLWFFNLLANRWTAALAAMLVPGALYFVISDIQRIQNEYLFFFNWENLLYLWITIALTKLVHEFAHAYTAKSFGLHVPQMGVAFLIFFPCLFCNTTDAWQLADRRQRVAISAAGVLAEGVLAILSVYVWHFSRPGMVNSLAFYLMAVSFISTIFFNGNPLMKFDGYFILTDYLRVPNLQAKSFAYIKYLFMNGALGISLVTNPATDARESALFTVYGISSFIYRIFLYTGIVAGVYYRFDKMLGILLALLAFSLFIVRPVIRGASAIQDKRSEIRPRLKGVIGFSILAVLTTAPFFVPLSTRSIYPCYVASANIQKLTIPLHTSVANVFVREWSHVEKGALLFELDASMLELDLLKKRVQRDVIRLQLASLLLDSKQRGKAEGKQIELHQAEAEIGRVEYELKTARRASIAPFDGVVTQLDYRVQRGFQPGEGVVVGQLESPDECVIYALIPETRRHKVGVGQTVEIWLPIRTGLIITKQIDSIKPYSEKDLRDSPFSSRLGGELATEVKGAQQRDAPLEAQYKCTVNFPNPGSAIRLGLTGKFAVPSPPQTLFSRLVDKMSRTFSRETLL